MRTVNNKWSKWKQFNVTESQIDNLLRSISCKLLITT
jgi:hypothetical protein